MLYLIDEFNDKNKIIKKTLYSTYEGETKIVSVDEYDNNGEKIKTTYFNHDSDKVSEMDFISNMRTSCDIIDGERILEYVTKYDPKTENKIKQTYYDTWTGDIDFIRIYNSSISESMIREIHYKNGKINFITEHDGGFAFGFLVQIFYNNGKLEAYDNKIYNYDVEKNTIEEIKYRDKELTKLEYISKIKYEPRTGKILEEIKRIFDDNRNVKERTYYNFDETIRTVKNRNSYFKKN